MSPLVPHAPTQAVQIEVAPGAVIETRAIRFGDVWQIPILATTPWGGFVSATICCDAQTFARVVAFAQAHGVIPRLADLVARTFGQRPAVRPVFGR